MIAAITGTNLLTFLITGLTVGGIYALSALGLVVVYRATGVLNFAQGAVGAIAALTPTVVTLRRIVMYQPCTSTAVNHGEQRGIAVTRKRAESRPNAVLPS